MKKLATLFQESYREFYVYDSAGKKAKGVQVKTVTVLGMFGAISILLGAMTVAIGDYIKIGFSTIANQFVYYLFGPVVGAIFGGTLDILKFIVKPTGAFFPGWTVSAAVAGVLYGLFLYRRPLKLWRVLAAELTVSVICNMLLGTLWLNIMYGQAFFAILPMRVLKNLIMWPINSVIFYTIAWTLEQGGVFKAFRGTEKGGID